MARPSRRWFGLTVFLVVLLGASVVIVALRSGGVALPDPGKPGDPVRILPTTTPKPGDGFVHPGVLVSAVQLDFVRAKLSEGAQPWTAAFDAMRASPYADLAWRPKPRATVECGPFNNPNRGCQDEADDAVAAYTHALLWYLTRDERHAQTAVRILDAWPGVIKRHTNVNGPLQTAWSAATFVRAAELIRHTSSVWPPSRADRFGEMLRTIYLPRVIQGAPTTNGNWELIMMDAAVGIAVFLEDRATFDRAVALWRQRVAAYVYLTSDGALPKPPPRSGMRGRSAIVAYWHGPTQFVDGLAQETCRDFGHTGWGLVAASHVAETARLQGLDLYAEVRDRLVTSLEFHAAYEQGRAGPEELCGGELELGFGPLPEIAYNHYVNRVGSAMPNTRPLLDTYRPEGAAFWFAWETLTHADNPY